MSFIAGLHHLPCRAYRQSSASSAAVAGGCLRRARLGRVHTRTAQRDDVQKSDESTASASDVHGAAECHVASAGASDISSAPLSLGHGPNLPALSCNPENGQACLNIQAIDDPCQDDSLDLKVFEYMEQLLESGMTSERAAAVVQQWSSGGGAAMVDLRKLRAYFMRTTLESVLWQHLPPVVALWTLTWLSYWSLGELPGADDALLHPALRGALVAVNLLLLVYFASGSLKRAGRLVRVGRAALDFSNRAELVLLALEDLASGHGDLILAARGQQSQQGAAAGRAAGRLQGSPLMAVQRRAARQRVLDACEQVMRYVKRQATTAAVRGDSETAAMASDGQTAGAGAVTAPTAAAAATRLASSPLSSLDSFLVLQAAAAVAKFGGGGGDGGADSGFDAVSELGLSPGEAAAAAAMYARYGDSTRGGKVGDFELRKLLQESGAPMLSEDERRLALLNKSSARRGWLTFRDWATWWAATPPGTSTPPPVALAADAP